jgi:EAL domain-containing protein (putative c-di-GMP-specific phosphodiesterase class I)
MGAHTLKSGLPVELGWYPGILAALLIIIAQARRTRPSRKITWASIAALALAPFVLDRVGIFYEIFPALISLGLAMRGLNKIASQRYEDATSLLKLEAAASESTAPHSNIYALKLLNLRGLGKGKESQNVAQFMERIARFVAQADPSLPIDTEFAVEGDTLVWCAPALPRSEIEEHSEGLLAIVRNALGHDRQGSKPRAVLGIDVNLGLDLEARIAHAISACEESPALENDFCISDAAHVSGVERRQHLLAELESAIEMGQIELGYQPKVHLQSGQIIGAEALLRWHHPEFGPIAAQEAVMLAEEHDLIDDLTLYIVERAVSELQKILRSDPEFKVSINFCSRTLTRRDVTEDVALILSKHDVPARQIIIEITESILLDFQSTRTTISELVALGVQISIDDFGTGYSNLEYIKQLPSAELKIDRRFVSSIGVSEDGEELVRGTIELAHSMSKTVVAEGVESKETADRLRVLGCDMAQGHLYSPAIPARALAKMLKETRMAA